MAAAVPAGGLQRRVPRPAARGLGAFHDEVAGALVGGLPNWGWLQSGFVSMVLGILVWIVALLVGFLAYKHVVLIVFGPFIGYIGEVADRPLRLPESQPGNHRRSRKNASG